LGFENVTDKTEKKEETIFMLIIIIEGRNRMNVHSTKLFSELLSWLKRSDSSSLHMELLGFQTTGGAMEAESECASGLPGTSNPIVAASWDATCFLETNARRTQNNAKFSQRW
jgi:hypothetical protein